VRDLKKTEMKHIDLHEFEKKYPDKEVVVDCIKKLKSLNLEKYDLKELNKMVNEGFHLIPFQHAFLAKGTNIFRGRVNHNLIKIGDNLVVNRDTFDFKINEFSMKTSGLTEYNRASIPGEATFYGSSNLNLACTEVLQNIKKTFVPNKNALFVTVGKWKVKKDLHMAPIYFSEKVSVLRKDIANYKSHYKSNARKIHKIPKAHDVSDLIMEFFCDEFCKKNIQSHHDYKLSALYARMLKDLNKVITAQRKMYIYDGLIYPSVAMNYAGDNISLFGENIDSLIELENAYKVLCFNFDFTAEIPKFNIAVIDEMDSNENGVIQWKKYVPNKPSHNTC